MVSLSRCHLQCLIDELHLWMAIFAFENKKT